MSLNSPQIWIPSREVLQSLGRAAVDPRYFVTRYCYTARKYHDLDSLDEDTTRAELFPDWEYFLPWYAAFRGRSNNIWCKTRQVGGSWVIMLCYLWAMTFKNDWSALITSKMGKYVDNEGKKSTYKSLFGKVRYAHLRLPEELQGDLEFTPLQIVNNTTGSFLDGETANPDAGRSGSYDAGLGDEAARIPWGEEVYSAMREASPRGLTLLSTPKGRYNVFARLYHKENTSLRIIRTFWWDHPERRCDCTEPLDLDPAKHRGCWYAHECETFTDWQIGSELNGSFEASTAGRVFPTFHTDRHVAAVQYIKHLPVIRSWDFGVGGLTAIIFWQPMQYVTVNGNRVAGARIFDSYSNSEQPVDHYVGVLQHKAQSYNRSQVMDIGDPYDIGRHAGAHELSSWYSNLRSAVPEYPIHVTPCDCRKYDYESILDNSRKLLKVVEVIGVEGAVDQVPRLQIDQGQRSVIEMFENWSYQTDEEGRIVSDKPLHNHYSHYGDSYKYGAWFISPLSADTMSTPTRRDIKRTIDKTGSVFSGGW